MRYKLLTGISMNLLPDMTNSRNCNVKIQKELSIKLKSIQNTKASTIEL